MEHGPFYRGGMEPFKDSTLGGTHESVRGAGIGALLALAVVLVIAAASAGLLVAGA